MGCLDNDDVGIWTLPVFVRMESYTIGLSDNEYSCFYKVIDHLLGLEDHPCA